MLSIVFGHGFFLMTVCNHWLCVRCWTSLPPIAPPPYDLLFCIFSRRALGASPFFGQCTNECTAVLSLFIVSNRRYWCPRSLSWLIVAFSGRVALSVEAPSPTSGGLSPPLVRDGAVQLLWVIECRRLVQSYSVAVASCQSFLATLRNLMCSVRLLVGWSSRV